MSAFDRLMITGVLWLTLLLVWRRLCLIAAMAEQTETLEHATEELSRSNAELDRFASVVAHDLRGPLNTIGLVTTVLAQRSRNTADSEDEWISDIRREIDSMSQLIERLLTYGRVGCGAIRPSPCDCETVFADVLHSLSANLQSNRVTVTHDPLPVVSADPILVAELLQNLLENAIRYRAGAAPRIHVSAAPERERWRFSVRDNGIGIKEPDRQRIFRPFTQLKRGGAGAGLGLATCKRIVERHGGALWVEPAADKGSTFLFTLPSVSVPLQPG
jgi:signal transduction histidine kinase